MEFLKAVVLGVVQGVTEFLPISSDGHLILVPSLMGWPRFGLGFDVILHVGTLLATVLYFRSDLLALARSVLSRSEARRRTRFLAWLLIGATVPSVLVVLAIEPFVDGVESRPVGQQLLISGFGFLGTAILLAVSEIIAAMRKDHHPVATSEQLTWPRALAIGFAQGFAALPGLSRSGTTIAAGQAMGMERGEAARFSFLLSVPIIAAATAKKSLDLASGAGSLPPAGVTLVGVVVTTVVGYVVMHYLLPFVRSHRLWWFAGYTALAGMLLIIRYGLF